MKNDLQPAINADLMITFLPAEAPQKNFTHTPCQLSGLHEQWIEIDHVHLLPSPEFTVFWLTLSLLVATYMALLNSS